MNTMPALLGRNEKIALAEFADIIILAIIGTVHDINYNSRMYQ